jgi:hypothetical protein
LVEDGQSGSQDRSGPLLHALAAPHRFKMLSRLNFASNEKFAKQSRIHIEIGVTTVSKIHGARRKAAIADVVNLPRESP